MADRQGSSAVHRCRRLLGWFTAALLVLSASFMLMPAAVAPDGSRTPALIFAGIMFWLGLLTAVITAVRINNQRRRSSKSGGKRPISGLFRFFQNVPATVADVGLISSVIGFAVSKFLISSLTASFVFLGLLVFCLGMHWLLNGCNYQYLSELP